MHYLCEDNNVGTPYFIMEYIDGQSFRSQGTTLKFWVYKNLPETTKEVANLSRESWSLRF